MIRGPEDDTTIGFLRQALGRSSLSASVIASNLANVDTPGYRALRAKFADHLMQAGQELEPLRNHGSHFGPQQNRDDATIVDAPITRMRADGNTVDVDREMTDLALQKGRFMAAAQLVRKRFALLRYAATDGKG